MRTFNFNLTFVIIFISFYCSVAIGSSPLGAEHSAPFQNSEPIPGVVKNEHHSIITEKELSPAPIIEEKEGAAGKEHLTNNGNQHSIVDEKVAQDTKEKGILSTLFTPFPPESSSPSGMEEGSLPMEGTDTQTTAEDSKSVQTITVEDALSILLEDAGHEEVSEAFVPVEPEEVPEELHIEEVKESSVTETVPSEPIPGVVKNEHESLDTEEILSPKKYLKRHLENVKKEGLPEKSPDREHLPIAVEKEAPSTVVEKDDYPTVPSLEPPATSLTTQTPTEGSETHSIIPENELSPAPIIEEKEGAAGKEHLTDNGNQHSIVDEKVAQDTKEKGILSTLFTPFPPESSSPSGMEEGSLPMEETDTQTTAEDSKSIQTATAEEALSILPEDAGHEEVSEAFVPVEPEEAPEELHIEEVKESSETVPSEPVTETIKEEKDLKPAWNIWHKDPTHNVLLAVAIILIAAKIGGWMAGMLRLPAVVGKLIIGMILGNVFTLTGWDFFDFLRTMPFVKMLSYFGTLILLFTAGLNTDLRALLRVGTSSFLVFLGGIIAPAGLALIVGHFLLPDTSSGTKLLLAIILSNTSMGLLVVILHELKAINTPEGRILIGAAVLTEIIVIVTFGVVVEFVAASGGVSFMGMLVSFGIAITFLIISLITILRYGEKFGNFLARRMTEGLNIPIVVILSLLLAFMFGSVGLHTVIGAFIAGLFLRNVKLSDSDDGEGEHRNVESFIRPFYILLVPILFVRVGAQVELESFLNLNAVLLGLAITGTAVIGKMFCSVCPIEKGINRLVIGIGMATRMEGTLILTGIAGDLGLLNDVVFSSVIMVIVLTSTICPSLLRSLLLKKDVHRKGLHIAAEKKELEKVTLN